MTENTEALPRCVICGDPVTLAGWDLCAKCATETPRQRDD